MNRRYRPRGLYLWLALPTFHAVFAATAGARETLASRTQAARQTLAATTPTSRTIGSASGVRPHLTQPNVPATTPIS